MPNILTRVSLAATALFRSPAATAAALERAAVRDLVGVFPDTDDPRVGGLLAGILPGSRGEPPPRGTAEYLRAYSTMPWLRAVADRHATRTGAVPWQVKALKGRDGKYVRDLVLQRADAPTRQKLFAAHRAAGGEVVELTDHPLYTLLNGGNDMMTGGSVRALTVLYLDLVGEGFFVKQRNAAGVPVGLWPLPPHWVRSTPTPSRPAFEVQVNTWHDFIPDTEVLWLKRLDPLNPYGRGTGVAQALGDELETDEYAAKMAKQAMFNRGDPSLIVSPKNGTGDLKEEQAKRLERAWLEKHRGFWKVARPHFSSRPIDVQVISRTFEELQLVPLRQFERDVIVQVFGMPPEQLGILENSNRSTIEASDLLMAKNLVLPSCEFLRESYQERLAPEYDERLIVDYVSPVDEDKDRQAEARKAAPYTVKVNEWRAAQGLPPDERAGDGYMVPFSQTFVEDLSEGAGTQASVSAGGGGSDAGGDSAQAAAQPDAVLRLARSARLDARPALFRAGTYSAKAIALDDDYYTLVHRVADRLAPKLRRQFMETIAKIQDATVLSALEAAFASGHLAAAEAAIPWGQLEALLNGGTKIIRTALYAAGEASASELSDALGVTLRFDRTNPAAEAWASANAARYVTEVTAETRQAIRERIQDAYAQQMTAQEASRLIRGMIGLDTRRAAAVVKFRARLIGDGVSGDALETRVAKYAAAQIKKRASLISRTELIDASNAGQLQLWHQAQEAGHLAYDRTRRKVLTTADDRLDQKVCEPMPYLDENQDVHLDQPFTTGDGRQVMAPTFHPGCRCAVGLEFDA